MESNAVLPHLEASSEKALRFLLNGRQLIPNDFHVTEVKRVNVASLDCGGSPNTWQELVVQLWSPRGYNSQDTMTAGKFLGILAKANASGLLDGAALRFEYGGQGEPAVQYHFSGVQSEGDTLDIHLTPPYVACRPLELADGTADGTCCAPNAGEACCA
jgi:hypothetical protein